MKKSPDTNLYEFWKQAQPGNKQNPAATTSVHSLEGFISGTINPPLSSPLPMVDKHESIKYDQDLIGWPELTLSQKVGKHVNLILFLTIYYS